MLDVIARFRELEAAGSLNLPLPGCGETAGRLRTLLEIAREDLSLARLVEAHTDACAILAEAGRPRIAGSWYGVWASDGPNSRVDAVPGPDGVWRLSGVKQYCSGAPYVTTALMTAHHDGAILLFAVDLGGSGIRVTSSPWKSAAFADTCTGSVSFEGVELPSESLLGGPGWYLERTGFWHGALSPAACWAGGACNLIDAAGRLGRQDSYSLAHRGALEASEWAFHAILDQAAREIDATPTEANADARRRALKVRHLIERQCTEVIDRFGRATGPQLLAYDEGVIRQHQALSLYIRQCHGERDLAGIPRVS